MIHPQHQNRGQNFTLLCMNRGQNFTLLCISLIQWPELPTALHFHYLCARENLHPSWACTEKRSLGLDPNTQL